MYESCIKYNTEQPMLLIRHEDMAICDKDVVAAALLSHLIYWHTWKLKQKQKNIYSNKVADRHGADEDKLPIHLWQFHTTEELIAALYVVKSPNTLRAAIRFLEKKGFIKTGKNPNPRFKFDNTKHFLVNVDAIQNAISLISEAETKENESVKNNERDTKNNGRPIKNSEPAVEINGTISEITSETTSEIASELNTERSQSSRVCEKPKEPDVIQSTAVANESRQPQDMNEVQEVEYISFAANLDPNITPPSAAPPVIPCEEENNEAIAGELVVVEVVQVKFGANMKGEKMPPNLQKIWDDFWSGKIDKIPYDECVAIARYEIGDVLEDVVFTGYWSLRPRFKQEFVNFRIANGLSDDAHARRTIKNELDPSQWDILRGSWQSFKLKQRGMTTKQVVKEFDRQQAQAGNSGNAAVNMAAQMFVNSN